MISPSVSQFWTEELKRNETQFGARSLGVFFYNRRNLIGGTIRVDSTRIFLALSIVGRCRWGVPTRHGPTCTATTARRATVRPNTTGEDETAFSRRPIAWLQIQMNLYLHLNEYAFGRHRWLEAISLIDLVVHSVERTSYPVLALFILKSVYCEV